MRQQRVVHAATQNPDELAIAGALGSPRARIAALLRVSQRAHRTPADSCLPADPYRPWAAALCPLVAMEQAPGLDAEDAPLAVAAEGTER